MPRYKIVTQQEWIQLQKEYTKPNRSEYDKQKELTRIKYFSSREYHAIIEYCINHTNDCIDLYETLSHLGLYRGSRYNFDQQKLRSALYNGIESSQVVILQLPELQGKPFENTPKPISASPPRPRNEINHEYIKRSEQLEKDQRQSFSLTIGVFFDGTGNNALNSSILDQCESELESDDKEFDKYESKIMTGCSVDKSILTNRSYQNGYTNVYKLFELHPDERQVKQMNTPNQAVKLNIKIYVQGIGTQQGKSDDLIGFGSGRGETGVIAKTKEALEKFQLILNEILENNPNTKIQSLRFNVFGFSRGAAAARYFSNLVADNVKLGDKNPYYQMIKPILKDWKHPLWISNGKQNTYGHVNFLGIFDTVAGIVTLANGVSAHNSDTGGVNIALNHHSAKHCVHLEALHEYRHNFSLNIIPNLPNFYRIPIPGAHSDIGGGYRTKSVDGKDQLEQLRITAPRHSYLGSTVNDNKESTAYKYAQKDLEWFQTHPQLKMMFAQQTGIQEETLKVDLWHQEDSKRGGKNVYATVKTHRYVSAYWSRVSLRMMYTAALFYGVPFKTFSENAPHHFLPDELTTISQKLVKGTLNYLHFKQPFPTLTYDELQLVLSKHIHCSAEYNRFPVWVDKPCNNWIRAIHANNDKEYYE